ncbi:vitamin B12 ABC transporter substrate-binding protein BtuF [Photobacterium sagamiensis]|uniref:vitamin B12 ABC transporter substrate-binding protein BtuF n=1 Tax=Photobacterium sagamiensis TaxID=2910241 RepID=UPI003D12F908
MRLICLCLLFFSAISAANQAVERVISLSPHTTELAYAAGLGDQLIAASDYSDYPEAATKLERVANYRGVKLERIVALKPDLILAWKGGNPPREMAKLEQLGIEVYYSNPTQLADIADTIEALGQYSAQPEYAAKTANQFRQQLTDLQLQHQNLRPVRFFYQLSASPIITAANGSWPTQIFTVCGGQNIFGDSIATYPQVSEEQVVTRQPEVIFGTPHSGTDTRVWNKWQGKLPAVDNQHIFTLQADWLNRPTPRSIKAVQQVCELLDSVRKNDL